MSFFGVKRIVNNQDVAAGPRERGPHAYGFSESAFIIFNYVKRVADKSFKEFEQFVTKTLKK